MFHFPLHTTTFPKLISELDHLLMSVGRTTYFTLSAPPLTPAELLVQYFKKIARNVITVQEISPCKIIPLASLINYQIGLRSP